MPLFIDFPTQRSSSGWSDTVGTVRSGKAGPNGKNPYSLSTWRITADTDEIAAAVAKLYGGSVEEWDTNGSDKFEVITESNQLPVKLLAAKNELIMWGQRKPIRTCDGATRTDNGEDCFCAAQFPKYWDRKQASYDGEACKPNIQLLLTLADLPDVGTFRWQTSAWLVAEDYANWLEEQAAGDPNQVIVMGLEPYTTKAGQTRQKNTFELLADEAA